MKFPASLLFPSLGEKGHRMSLQETLREREKLSSGKSGFADALKKEKQMTGRSR